MSRDAAQSWAGISIWRRVGYYLSWIPAVIGALLSGPWGAGGGSSPMDPRRLRKDTEARQLEGVERGEHQERHDDRT